MKYLKTYEQKERQLDIGDYVICNLKNKDFKYEILDKFTSNNVGKIINREEMLINKDAEYLMVVYDNWYKFKEKYPTGYKQFAYPIPMYPEEIVFNSKDKNDCLIKLESDKFNI